MLETGLLLDSWVRLAKIACLNKNDIYKRLGVFCAGDKNKQVQFGANYTSFECIRIPIVALSK